jgi:ComF family protein
VCWSGLSFIAPPWCAGCALPFDHDRGEEALCGTCLAAPPRHAGARAAVAYGEVAKTVALRLKYAGRTAFAETAARQMLRVLPDDADLLVPVPLHRWRLWSRGYNQAALIADAIGKARGVPHDPALLVRTKRTPVLRGLGPRARAKAVAGAFAVHGDVRGKHVVLVDDVYTTGATANACVAALLKAKVAKVTILAWARVIDTDASD